MSLKSSSNTRSLDQTPGWQKHSHRRPVYTLLDRKAVEAKGDAWAWECRGRYWEPKARRHPVQGRTTRCVRGRSVNSTTGRYSVEEGEPTAFTGMLYDPNEPFGRVRSPDRGWEELNSQEMERGRQKLAARRPFHQVENPSANIRRVCPEDHGRIFSEHKVLSEEWTARLTRTFLNSHTLFAVIQSGVHAGICSIFLVVEEKGRLKTVRFREPFAHAVS